MNLLKCDNCGNRNILCFNCESNEHYRSTAFSHDEYVKRKAIEGYVEAVVKGLEELREKADENSKTSSDYYYRCGLAFGLNKAIKIVKGGVKNE